MPNYYIGIGGTGARVAEALVHLCAAGYGPDRLTIFLIDPDQGNGNLGRTARLIANYRQARETFRERTTAAPFLRTEIRTPSPFVWTIFRDQNVSLAEHIRLQNQDAALQDFTRVLFSEEELRTPLNEGFRGHPNIGAAILADINDKTDEEPWKTFWADVENTQQAGGMRVFLAGSIFGGTGAAGIPTLGSPNVIKRNLKAKLGDRSKVRLGAALVLPYFTFDPGTSAGPQMFVTAADFPIATKAALHYYQTKPLAFDDLYLVGDSLGQNVGQFSPGARQQENAPHYIELVSALAATDFYATPDAPLDEPRRFLAAREGKQVGWQDLPTTREEGAVGERQGVLRRRLTTLAAFAYAVLDYGLPTLDEKPLDGVPDAWHDAHFYPKKCMGLGRDKTRDPREARSREALGYVGDYLQRYLTWLAGLDESADGIVRLAEAERFMDKGGDLLRHDAHPHAVGAIMRDRNQEKDFTAFLNVLNETQVGTESMSPSDTFINLFYEAAQRFAEDNYALPPEPARQP